MDPTQWADRVKASVECEFTTAAGPLLEQIASARSIVVFGSFACGTSRAASDLDVLLVGTGQTRKLRGVDLIWVPECRLETTQWLGSELAQHVGAFGIPLRGDNSWRTGVFSSEEAVAKKWHRLSERIRLLAARFGRLNRRFRAHNVQLVRRDLARLDVMLGGAPVPSTPQIDDRIGAMGIGAILDRVKTFRIKGQSVVSADCLRLMDCFSS